MEGVTVRCKSFIENKQRTTTHHSPIWKTLGALIVIVINPDSARGAIPAPRLDGMHVCAIYCRLQSQL